MRILTKRIYESADSGDCYRVLVDRIWPRGVKTGDARVDRWMKSIAPSTELRQWFAHDPAKWTAFKKRYFAELRYRKDELRQLLDEAGDGNLTLLYSAKDEKHNNAVALAEYLCRMKR